MLQRNTYLQTYMLCFFFNINFTIKYTITISLINHSEMKRSKRGHARENNERNGMERVGNYQEKTVPRNRGQPKQPCDVCPGLVVRVRVSPSSLYRGNQIARHKFCLCAVMRVKETHGKISKIEKRNSRDLHISMCSHNTLQ